MYLVCFGFPQMKVSSGKLSNTTTTVTKRRSSIGSYQVHNIATADSLTPIIRLDTNLRQFMTRRTVTKSVDTTVAKALHKTRLSPSCDFAGSALSHYFSAGPLSLPGISVSRLAQVFIFLHSRRKLVMLEWRRYRAMEHCF